MKENMRYYCDSFFKQDDDEKWFYLLDIAFSKCNTVEFNILLKGYNTVSEINELSKYLIRKSKKNEKIFVSGYSIEYLLNDSLKSFIKSKRYIDWRNYHLEDIALLQNGQEILSTITHENYVIMLMSENQRNELNSKGFDFSFDFGAEPFKRTK